MRCWFNCATSGVAGDMLLGSLLDAGADLDEVRRIVAALPVDGWALDAEPVLRGGIAATRAVVTAPEQHHHRTWADIRRLLHDAPLPDRVRTRATATFAALAEVEGALHRTPPDDVHFHEVGALDAIVDVVGTCAALEVLDIDLVSVSAIATGQGTTTAAHGNLPIPAPATAALLTGLDVVGVDVAAELATPTGVALVRTLSGGGSGTVPAMEVTATGYGAGARDLEGRPNVVQVLVGHAGAATESLVLLESNVDDVTGEVLAHTIARLLDAGALDAWATPIVMKKGRPAHTVAALVRPASVVAVGDAMVAETGTLGIRRTPVERQAAERTEATVEVDGHRIRVKVTAGRVKVEFDDAAAVAASTGRPVREVLARAEATYSGREESDRQSAR
jgi:uncharacterized protein (TIGR00299 family) protein